MRCSFCGRRIRGDYIVFRDARGRTYHYATEGPRRHCSAAASYYAETTGARATIYTDQPQEPQEVRA